VKFSPFCPVFILLPSARSVSRVEVRQSPLQSVPAGCRAGRNLSSNQASLFPFAGLQVYFIAKSSKGCFYF
jgi:hypothetical protein